ncbi:hypothetical protein Rleg4DRAFT_1435 [Rhizobium leguminosarum bv. trifolii WSM2297]|uniref:Uncharacterized protein n=1 Tax=Rhizobium leguminosarum bv. trifolii WSM2297 TaxID=754762 RepID=J0W3W3_RHILT|nr:hypothetical protein Rleg4DRAFT_1435 [Rhizobium leguminosarum bv. trifolii WSM2297]
MGIVPLSEIRSTSVNTAARLWFMPCWLVNEISNGRGHDPPKTTITGVSPRDVFRLASALLGGYPRRRFAGHDEGVA